MMTKSNSKRSGYAIIDDYSTHRSFPPSLPSFLDFCAGGATPGRRDGGPKSGQSEPLQPHHCLGVRSGEEGQGGREGGRAVQSRIFTNLKASTLSLPCVCACVALWKEGGKEARRGGERNGEIIKIQIMRRRKKNKIYTNDHHNTACFLFLLGKNVLTSFYCSCMASFRYSFRLS